jgi:diacylglycerol kinase
VESIIKIARITSFAMTEEAGKELRDLISKELEKNEKVTLDFASISMFATPFFNASIGYFVLNLTPVKYSQLIKMENLSELGVETYNHSLENAIDIFNKKINLSVIGEITKNTIEEK